MSLPARLLITIPASGSARRSIGVRLPDIPFHFLGDGSPVGLEATEVMVCGNLSREFPGLSEMAWPALRFVQTIHAGLERFPFGLFPEKVLVAGNGGAYASYVAEHALALLLGIAHRLSEGDLRTRRGELRPSPMVRHLEGQTALLVGYGEIGRACARLLRSLGMRTIGVNRQGTDGAGVDQIVPTGRLDAMLSSADVVIDCLPLTRLTWGRFGADQFQKMRSDAIFINMGRAETVGPEALRSHLAAHPQFRFGSDVWWNEDFSTGRIHHPFGLSEFPDILSSPHRASLVPGATALALDWALDNVARYFAGRPIHHLGDRAEYWPIPPFEHH